MNINRNNYEDFFLLYVDGELNSVARKQVEDFVKNNPDLEEELLMLNDTVLRPDPNICMPGKKILYRNNGLVVNESASDALFILFHDNELDETGRKQTLELLAKHPELKPEFDLIAESKIKPEDTKMMGKEMLYRETKNKKVYRLIALSIAAAVIISFCIYGGIDLIKEESQIDTSSIAKHFAVINAEKQSTPHINIAKENSVEKNNINSTPEKKIIYKSVVKDQNKIVIPKDEKALMTKTLSPEDKDLVINELPEAARGLPLENEMSSRAIETSEKIISANIPEASESNITQPASLVEEQQNNDNYVFYNVSEEKFRKSKVGIFLKKASRVITRNALSLVNRHPTSDIRN